MARFSPSTDSTPRTTGASTSRTVYPWCSRWASTQSRATSPSTTSSRPHKELVYAVDSPLTRSTPSFPTSNTATNTTDRPPSCFSVTSPLRSPSVFREQLLLRLHVYGIPNNIWQHLRALHHSIRGRILHGHNDPTSYVNILKGLRWTSVTPPMGPLHSRPRYYTPTTLPQHHTPPS